MMYKELSQSEMQNVLGGSPAREALKTLWEVAKILFGEHPDFIV